MFENILVSIFALIPLLGVLVFVHELGHYLAAKLFGVRVERFSIGFPPRLFGTQIGETDYCVSAIPLGGYVKLSGMIDESLDAEQMEKDPEPHEFRSKPMYQKAIIISAGVIMNFILAVLILGGIVYFQGERIITTTKIGSVPQGSLAADIGLQANDKILAINGDELNSYNDISLSFLENLGEDVRFTVERNGKQKTLVMDWDDFDLTNERGLEIEPYAEARIGALQENYPAVEAGLEVGDLIVQIDSMAISSWSEMRDAITPHAGKTLDLLVLRGEEELSLKLTPKEFEYEDADGNKLTRGLIGIAPQYEMEFRTYPLLESLWKGFSKSVSIGALQVKGFGWIFSGKESASESLTGPVGIAQMAGQFARQGLLSWLNLVAMLSVVLAIVNILPIPALDGGHLIIIIAEGVLGRPVSVKAKIAAQQIGMLLLLMLLLFATFNDFTR